MAHLSYHGGGCCGRLHYYNFTGQETAESIRRDLTAYSQSEGGNTRGKSIEAVLTDSQFRYHPHLAQALKDNGFRIVDRFYNSTGGMCNVLLRTGGRRRLENTRSRAVRTLMEGD